jgi:hypothetical protein
VIDVGCGSGVLAIVAAKLGAAKVYRGRPLPAGRGGGEGERSPTRARHICEFRAGDLLEPVRDVQANVLIGDVSGIPDAIAKESGWFDDVPAGGPTGAELPAKFLRSIGDTLAMGGRSVPPDGNDPSTSRPSSTPRTRSSATTCGPCSNASSRSRIWSPGRRPSPA